MSATPYCGRSEECVYGPAGNGARLVAVTDAKKGLCADSKGPLV
jgi:hypothetical protein